MRLECRLSFCWEICGTPPACHLAVSCHRMRSGWSGLGRKLLVLVLVSFLVGLTTVIAQILIPLATELARPQDQGRTIGAIMTGVLLGILLARTLSGALALHFGMARDVLDSGRDAWLFAGMLRLSLPPMPAHAGTEYRDLMRSLWEFVREHPKLRQVSLVAAMFLAAFGAFWTTLSFLLKTPPYHLGSQAAGLFGLVGGAVSALVPPPQDGSPTAALRTMWSSSRRQACFSLMQSSGDCAFTSGV